MYINWFHHFVPQIFGYLAFIVNPYFVHLIFTEKVNLGNYRFLFSYFALFNIFHSLMDIFVPIMLRTPTLSGMLTRKCADSVGAPSDRSAQSACFQGIHGTRYCFLMFLSDGWLFKKSELSMFLLAVRCSLIACTYAVLISHFVYRYLTIRGSSLVMSYFPGFMIASFCLCAFGSVFWIVDATLEILIKSYFGVVAGTFVSVGSISIFITFGILIMNLLKEKRLSEKTARLQKELLRALIVQTAIPICLSFAPCMLSWYTPMFNLKLGKWLNYTGAVALAAFPFIDPVAVILCLPGLRKRIFGDGKLHHEKKCMSTVTVHKNHLQKKLVITYQTDQNSKIQIF
ncbi:Protein CBR-SRJ-32 [Caenorhabditis briggsae]|uniref:Protein CBR-SRJ-32 n=1 Tax=Caenorhabditis briggsae TaxID=6238 RepID=A8Y297_CAEBR|nr:Protein CBR-SRJ-32 [Caenorhabditis briggsae]CAP39017.2 Protein CBR-SRJ-32 [Caenorhabditis briggsae]